MADFTGKRCIITGAGQGIGRAIALGLAERGAQIIAVSKTLGNLEALKAEVPSAISVVCDIENIEDLKKKIQPHLPVHILVNNAGTAIAENFVDVTPDTFDKVFNVNLRSAFFLTQYVVKSMLTNNIKGSILHVSSQASTVCLPQHIVYSCTKSALDSLTRTMAYELGPNGIRVNAINPTVIMTELAKKFWEDPTRADAMLSRIPLRKFGDVDDCVKATLFLLSDDAKMITGTCLPIDGGACAV